MAASLLDWVKSAFRQLANGTGAERIRAAPGADVASSQAKPDASLAREKFALGRTLRAAGRLGEAIRAFEEGVALRHDDVDGIVALAGAYAESGKNEDALDYFQLALAFDPACAAAHLGAGRILRAQSHDDAAAGHFRLAAGSPGDCAEAWFELGLTLNRSERPAEAEAAYRRALELRPDYAEAAVNLGLILLAADADPAAGEALFRQAAASDPSLAAAKVNLGLALQEQGRFEDAIEVFDRAIPVHPDTPELVWHRAMTRLIRGDYVGGWDDHEARKRIFRSRHERDFPFPEWTGEPLAGRTILVYAEQGLGDEIMFASCLPDLIGQGARCIVECDPRLAEIYGRSFPKAIVHGVPRNADRAWLARHPEIELQAAVGSLPRYLRKSAVDFPRHAGYLVASPVLAARWRDRLARLDGGLKVGISWQGGTPKNRAGQRSIPLALWETVLRVPDVCFVSLQRGGVGSPLAGTAPGMILHHWPDALAGVEDTAALISALDLVVTIDSTIAHLTGALGRPERVLLAASPDWRWLWEGEMIPWYPSACAVRQRRRGEWGPVMVAVASEIARRTGRLPP